MSGAILRRGDSTARRLGTAFGLLIALLLALGAGALTCALWVDSTHHEVIEELEPAQDANVYLHSRAAIMHRSLRTYLLTGDRNELESYDVARADTFAALSSAQRHATGMSRASFARQVDQLQSYVRLVDQQAKAEPRSEEAVRLTPEAARRFDAFEATNLKLDAQLIEHIERVENRAAAVLEGSTAAIGVLLALAVLVGVSTALNTTRALTRPLGNVERTLGRLTAGDRMARAREEGPLEIRAVARSVNELADERDRLRAIEEERERLSETARRTGVAVREHLDVDHVLDTACVGIGEGLDADYVFVMLTEENSPLVPVARAWSARRGLLPPGEQTIPPVPGEVVREHYRRGETWSLNGLNAQVADGAPLPGAPGSFGSSGLPPQARAAAEDLGLVSVVVTPIGVGEDPLGAVFLARTRPDKPWRPVEIEFAESMATGVGRALHSAVLYEQETHLVEKLQALDRAKSDFMSTVSHELRTPLTSIVGYIELLKDEDTGPLSQPQRHMLDVVDRNANRLRSLIEDLLTLSRIESGAFTSNMAAVDLRELVGSATDAIKPAAEAASVELETHCPEQPLILHADGEQLDRVLMNLLSNAVKFTPEGGRVSVRADRRDGEAVLSVSDTGIGIPAKEQEKLFQRFFRASNATDAAIPGTGLGLTIVRTIVANHGGETEVQSEEGRGTTITARLPIAVTHDATGGP
ncbi:sensor histidine kinase [Streptomyces cavernae]|uniref:sensor histidine kinase n=1 Tax=Streptomyces cavernae TaxID=2259034 RepID=UPI000FEBB36A|nr:ATP-binding protein [Streptomyces cavernae]